MALDDLPLHRPGPPPGERPGQAGASPARWIVVGAFAVALGALLSLWWMSRARPGSVVPAPTSATEVAVRSNRPKQQPMELPTLEASDAVLRRMVSALSRHPLLARFLATQGLITNSTLAVEQIGNGRTPADPLKVLRPAGRLAIVGAESGRVDPVAYARWDSAVSSLVSIDPADAAQVYVNVKQLYDQAYRDLGHPGGDFDESIVRAIQMLGETPTPSTELELLRRPGYFEQADPALKSLPPVQKQLLLIGPANRQKIMAWLRRFATALDLKIS
jgi:Protein of unknown function (DUF3014)